MSTIAWVPSQCGAGRTFYTLQAFHFALEYSHLLTKKYYLQVFIVVVGAKNKE